MTYIVYGGKPYNLPRGYPFGMGLKGRHGRIKDHHLIPGTDSQMRLGPGLIPQTSKRRNLEMSWKKRFAPSVRIGELVNMGPMKIDAEPVSLGQGKFRVRATLKDGGEVQFTTFEGTIGNICEAAGDKGYAEPYYSEEKNARGDPYVNWRAAKP